MIFFPFSWQIVYLSYNLVVGSLLLNFSLAFFPPIFTTKIRFIIFYFF